MSDTTMTVHLEADEWYPVISITTEPNDKQVVISKELFERHNRIMQEFDDMQDLLYKLFKGRAI